MPITIHQKSYYTVAERLASVHQSGKKFEMLESAPMQVGDAWIWRVVIQIDERTYIGHAIVHTKATSGAEAQDCWAVAETSAVGRAIAFAGFLSDGSIASADEVQAA